MDRERWIRRNNFEDNQEYAEKVLSRFELPKYHFAYDNGTISLLIERNLRKYKIELNDVDCTMDIYRCNVNAVFGKYTKENMSLKKRFDDDCIWNAIKWVAHDSNIST